MSVQADGGTWGTGKAANGKAQLASAVVETDGRAYIGGAFTKMVPPNGGSSVTRNRLAALDVNRKTLLPWKTPPSDATSQYPLPDGLVAMPTIGRLSRIPPVDPRNLAAP